MKQAIACLSSLAALAALAGCGAPQIAAPSEKGVCYVMRGDDKTRRFDVIARDLADIEHCAAQLERMRLNLERLGSAQGDVTGIFQGHFVFLTADGIFTSDRLEGTRFLLLVRYNGSLVMPAAVPQ